jgi:hypothetical protein
MFLFLVLLSVAGAAQTVFKAVIAHGLSASPAIFQAGGAILVLADRARAQTVVAERLVAPTAQV